MSTSPRTRGVKPASSSGAAGGFPTTTWRPADKLYFPLLQSPAFVAGKKFKDIVKGVDDKPAPAKKAAAPKK